MGHRILSVGALVACIGASLLPGSGLAQEASLEQRLRELEGAYTELLVRDREKTREMERLRGEVSALRQGRRDAAVPAAQAHPHEHRHAATHDHDHDHDPTHAVTDGGDVLLESGGFRV